MPIVHPVCCGLGFPGASAIWKCVTSGDGNSYAFDLQAVMAIYIHV